MGITKKTFEFLNAAKDRNSMTKKDLKLSALNSLMLIAEEFGELLAALNLDQRSRKRISQQLLKRIAQQVFEGNFSKLGKIDVPEIVDALCDLKVVISNFEYFLYLEKTVANAIDAVEENNLTKFITVDFVEASVKGYKELGIDVIAVENPSTHLFALIDSNGKIRKPITYIPVQLQIDFPTIKTVEEILES